MKTSFRVSGKPVTVPAAVPSANALSVSAWQQLLTWESKGAPVAVDLELEIGLPSSAAPGFPPVRPFGLCAGGYYDQGGGTTYTWDDSAEGCVVLKIECGTGSNPRTLYADARGGRFALGPNEWVRVAVARWLAAGSSPVLAQAGIGPSDGSGDYLTYSAVIDGVAAAGQAVLAVPAGALWWDFYPIAGGSWSATSMEVANAPIARRYESAATPVYNPPTSPLPLLGSNGIVLTNQGAAASGVCAVFYVR